MLIKFSFLLTLFIPTSEESEIPLKCRQTEHRPTIGFSPPESVTRVNSNIYVVNPEWRNKTFVMNCTSRQRVDWRFKGSIGNTVTRSERSVSFDRYENNLGFTGSCYSSALIFSTIENEITGQYTCIERPSLNFNPEKSNGIFNQVILYSGLSPMTIHNQTKTYDLNWLLILLKKQNYDTERYPYQLPCAINHPNATLSLFYSQSYTQEESWVEVYDFEKQPAVSITIELFVYDLPRKYKCKASLDNQTVNTLYIDIPYYPNAVYWPDVANIVYKTIPHNIFYCISRLPIRFIKDEEQPTSLESTMAGFVQYYRNMGFNYTAAVTVDARSKVSKREGDSVGSVTCQDIGTNGSLINWTWNYSVQSGNKNNNDRSYLNGPLKSAVCKTSVNQEHMSIRYIQASTHAELSLQQKCLELPYHEWNICNHPKMDLRGTQDPTTTSSVFAGLPPGISGAFQCLTPDVFNDGDHYKVFSETTLNELGNVGSPYEEYIQFSSIILGAIEVGNIIEATCKSSVMYFHGHGILIFVWSNSTHSSVPPEWIMSDNITKIDTFYERHSKIKAGSVDIIGITCVAVPVKSLKDRRRKVVYPSVEYKAVRVKPKTPILSLLEISVITLSVTVGVVLLLIFAGFIWMRRQKLGRRDIVFEKSVELFFHGYEPKVEDASNPCETAESQPYDDSFEILMEQLTIHWDSPLGAGAYGFVLNGTYTSISNDKKQTKSEKKVAVKTLKDDVDSAYLKALMSELKVMIFIGKHDNLVALVGAITGKLSQRELYVILEHCQNGSLEKYLKQKRANFADNFDRMTGICSDNFQQAYTNLKYQNHYEITSVDLLRWSRQIISGMQYLVSKKVIHGDLAVRNILLDEFLTAKISDFGLSRRLFEQYEYVKKSQEPLPWRNMALESLRELTFSSETDVWSFGVTLWEIFSLAKTPYLGNMYSVEFIQLLEDGFRLSIPEYAPQQIYDVMLPCWHSDPSKRPTFSEIASILDGIIHAAVSKQKDHQLQSDMDRTYANVNFV